MPFLLVMKGTLSLSIALVVPSSLYYVIANKWKFDPSLSSYHIVQSTPFTIGNVARNKREEKQKNRKKEKK